MFLVEVTAPNGSVQRQLVSQMRLSIGSGPKCVIQVPGASALHAHVDLRVAYSTIACVGTSEVMIDGVLASAERLASMPAQIRVAEHTIAIRDVTPPRFEASYGAIAPEEAALVDAIVTGDVASRIVYADWLEERGDTARADIVRRLAEGEQPDGELLVELARTNVRWRARVLEPAIEGCPRLVVSGPEQCPGHWGALERSGRADMRRCATCTKLVLYAVDNAQAKEHQDAGGNVVFDPFAVRTLRTR